ncbi:MAG: ABC transporter substrate-binding protein [Treponema sp.]|jgi:NitT/TauT family transport system substrate-binding protein|nr:ABC transporter substrate-binding protein [Treponema sp.]
MNKMKNFLVIAICIISAIIFVSAGSKDISESVTDSPVVRVSALKGPTAMGMVKLMKDADEGQSANTYSFSLTSIDEITPRIARGDVDIAAVPANLAAVFYNNAGKYQVMAINTLGVLYIVEKGNTIHSVEDLRGKTLYVAGNGAVPEYALNYVLINNGLVPGKDVFIEFKSEPAEIIPFLLKDDNGIAMLPQPFAATAQMKIEGLRIALDLTKEWDSVATEIAKDGSSFVTSVMVVKKDFADQYPELVKTFAEEYQASTAWVNSHVPEAAVLVGNTGIAESKVAEIALPYCNITYIDGLNMKEKMSGYLQTLYDQNPKSIGEKMPDEGFYYIAK